MPPNLGGHSPATSSERLPLQVPLKGKPKAASTRLRLRLKLCCCACWPSSASAPLKQC